MTLIAIGGAEDKTGDKAVLQRVLAETGRDHPRVLVVTTATAYKAEAAANYGSAFSALGAACQFAHIADAAGAADAGALAAVKEADVIFFTGGDQSRLVDVLAGSPFLAAVQGFQAAGGVVAGTSAGAMAMSALMIAGGDPENGMVRGGIAEGTGFGMAPALVIDTHFTQRNRLSRLFNMISADPRKTGLGLDEDTALIMRGRDAEVAGSGTVTIVTGEKLPAVNPAGQGGAIPAEGYTIHTYKSGARLKL